MKITCPYCDNKFSFEEAVRVKISHKLGEALQKFGDHKFLAWEYAGTFATKPFGPISVAKRLRILTELLRLWETGIFKHQGKRYKIDRAGIVAGMRTVCDVEKYGFKNHNYLKRILPQRAERVSAEGLTAKEEQKKIEDQKTRRSEHQNNDDLYSPDALAAFKKKMGVSKVKDLIKKRPEVGEDV